MRIEKGLVGCGSDLWINVPANGCIVCILRWRFAPRESLFQGFRQADFLALPQGIRSRSAALFAPPARSPSSPRQSHRASKADSLVRNAAARTREDVGDRVRSLEDSAHAPDVPGMHRLQTNRAFHLSV